MIAIVNVSKKYSRVGIQDYEVRINTKVVTEFQHSSEEGLAVCLEKAAKAVRLAEAELLLSVLEQVDDE